MTREETKKLLMVINATYPNFKSDNMTDTVNAWAVFLEGYEYNDIMAALKIYVATSSTGFAPSVSQLIGMIGKAQELTELTESEAWSMVSKAVRNGAYNSTTEFEKLPPEVQKAVGSSQQLRVWAMDENYNESVAMSLFQRNYRQILNRNKEVRALPSDVRALIEGTAQTMIEG